MIDVSVIMSVFDTKEYFLRKTVESILNQTLGNFEFIIINDGATDGSPGILKEYASKDQRVHLIHQENIGLTRSLNKGLRMAKGKYVARQDASDISHPRRLEKQVAYMEQNCEVVVCWTWFSVIDEKDHVIGKFEFPTSTGKIKKKLLKSNVFAHSSSFFRREEIIDIGGYRDTFKKAQDMDLWLRVIEKYEVGAIGETLLFYRYEKDSMTVSDNSDQTAYRKLANKCYDNRIRHGDDKDCLDDFSSKSEPLTPRTYSKNNLYLANLFLRSGKNSEARGLFRNELKKEYDHQIMIKLIMSCLPFNWSKLYRIM